MVLLNVAQQDSAAISSFNRVTFLTWGFFLNVAQQFVFFKFCFKADKNRHEALPANLLESVIKTR